MGESMLTYDDLVNDLKAGCKPRANWRIGLEYERFAFNLQTGAPLPYDGTPGIRILLEAFASRHDCEKYEEGGFLIALQKNGMTVTLEPGGQVEYSGSPLRTLREAREEMDVFCRSMDAVARELGIGFLAQGVHPSWRREDIPWMPKARYAIMRPYMQNKGRHGIDMMGRTCGAQINLDFSDEADMVKKFRVAMALQPVAAAIMANSPIVEGKASGYASYRSFIWIDTDPDRCGFLPFVFRDDMGFSPYVDYALDVPMYFIRRNGHYVDATGKSFRDFMAGKLPGHEGEYPALPDWHDHLTTLFPDVRLKKYIELRGADSGPPEMVCAMAAFWTGVLYDQAALDEAHAIVTRWPMERHAVLRETAMRSALEDKTLAALACDMATLSREGLVRLSEDESLLSAWHLPEPGFIRAGGKTV